MVELEDLKQWILNLQEVYTENKEYLTDLDSAIGDADHGINMARGFNKVKEEIEKGTFSDVPSFFSLVGMTLIKTVGGASGPLYGALFLYGGKAVAEESQSLSAEDIRKIFQKGYDRVSSLGKSSPGEKTMLDAWKPALESMEKYQDQGIQVMLTEAVQSAEKGMKSTIDMLATKGRASYLGERSIGHQDPGATSTFLMLETASKIWR